MPPRDAVAKQTIKLGRSGLGVSRLFAFDRQARIVGKRPVAFVRCAWLLEHGHLRVPQPVAAGRGA